MKNPAHERCGAFHPSALIATDEKKPCSKPGVAQGERPRAGCATAWEGRDWAGHPSSSSAGDDEVDGLWAFSLLSGSTSKEIRCPSFSDLRPACSTAVTCRPASVAAAVIGLDEAVAALGIEKFDGTCRGHRQALLSPGVPPPAPARRHGPTFTRGGSSVTLTGPHEARTSKRKTIAIGQSNAVEKVAGATFADEPIEAMRTAMAFRQRSNKLRQQQLELACEPPRGIDDEDAAGAQALWRARNWKGVYLRA